GHKDREHEISHLQIHGFGQGLDVGKDGFLAPVALGFQLPKGELQNTPNLAFIQFIVSEVFRLQVQHAAEHELGHGGYVREHLCPALDVRHQRSQVVTVEPPLVHALHELLVAQLIANPLAIQPTKLLHIKHGTTERHTLDVEVLDHLIQGELLALVRHGPAHAAQVVGYRLRQKAHALIEVDASGVL